MARKVKALEQRHRLSSSAANDSRLWKCYLCLRTSVIYVPGLYTCKNLGQRPGYESN